jgi:hypothetical protein
MGMSEAPAMSSAVSPATGRTSLADALFTATQQRILGLLFGQPERSFYANELIALTGSGSGAVQRELARLAASGLVVARLIGRQKHYQANPDSPIFADLRRAVRHCEQGDRAGRSAAAGAGAAHPRRLRLWLGREKAGHREQRPRPDAGER